jgi:hypothetical protein
VILVEVSIGEWDQFWSVFTSAGQELRTAHGSRGVQAFRDADDPHRVWLLFDWTRDEFERFLADPQVPPTMRSGGAQGPPTAHFLERAGELPH